MHITTVSHFLRGTFHCANILIFQINLTNPSENVVELTNFSMACAKDSWNADNRQITVSLRYVLPLKIDLE